MAHLQVFATIAGGNKQVLLIAVKNRSPAAILRYSDQFFHLNETE